MLGVAYPIKSVPGLAVTTEFRYFGVLSGPTYHGAIDSGFRRAQLHPNRAG